MRDYGNNLRKLEIGDVVVVGRTCRSEAGASNARCMGAKNIITTMNLEMVAFMP